MRENIHFATQVYVRHRSGCLNKGQWYPCHSAKEAMERARRAVDVQGFVGAVALSQRSSGEFDEGEAAITIAEFGDVPECARDEIPF